MVHTRTTHEFIFNPWVWRISWRREQLITPVFLPGEFHGQRSMAGYSPWDCKELDMTEWLTLYDEHQEATEYNNLGESCSFHYIFSLFLLCRVYIMDKIYVTLLTLLINTAYRYVICMFFFLIILTDLLCFILNIDYLESSSHFSSIVSQ